MVMVLWFKEYMVWQTIKWNKVIHLRKECMEGIRLDEWMGVQLRTEWVYGIAR